MNYNICNQSLFALNKKRSIGFHEDNCINNIKDSIYHNVVI